jgi:hypothetical protein
MTRDMLIGGMFGWQLCILVRLVMDLTLDALDRRRRARRRAAELSDSR